MSVGRTEMTQASWSAERLGMTLRLSVVALAAVAISAQFTDYGPLIPLLQSELHIPSGATGLLSTLLYVGIGLSYLPGGWLTDRYGSRRVLFWSLLLVAIGGCLLPAIPDLVWIVLCRLVIGLGAGAAIVAGSLAARQRKYAALGLGLFGGAMQVGAGLGLLVTPTLFGLLGWRGTFVVWGALALVASFLCLWTLDSEVPQHTNAATRQIAEAFRSPSLWMIGLVLLGTLGLGQAIAPWLAVYFIRSYGLSLSLSALLGAVGLLAGMLFRPLGGLLLSRKVFSPGTLMGVGTVLACLGVVLLALPPHSPLVTGWGLALFGCGTTLPYAATFDEASTLGTESTLGPGTAQGVVSVIAAPASAFGPPLIGVLLGPQGSFTLPFAAMVPLGMVAVIAALFAGSILTRTSEVTDLQRLRIRDGDAYLAQVLAGCSRVQSPSATLPAIVLPGAFAQGEAAMIRRLQRAGGLPILLPPPLAQGEAGDLLTNRAFFREVFDRHIWPLFCQLLVGQTRGLCLSEGGQRARETNGTHTPSLWSASMQRYLALLAWLIGMPVLGAGWELHSLELNYRSNEQAGPGPPRLWPLSAPRVSCNGHAEEPTVYAQFVAACAAYRPPSLEELLPLCDAIFDWLRRRDRALVRQLYQLQVTWRQGTTGIVTAPAPAMAGSSSAKQETLTKTIHRK